MTDLIGLAEVLVSFIGIYYILTAALNVKAGMTGIPDFGHAMFFAVGGIAVANITARIAAVLVAGYIGVSPGEAFTLVMIDNTDVMLKVNAALADNPVLSIILIIVSIIIALLLGGMLGWLASYPALRLRGDYLAIMLLAASEGARVFATYTQALMGSTPTVGLLSPNLFAFTGNPGLWSTVFIAVSALGVYVYSERLYNSPSGRLFRAVRDDEDTARSIGKSIEAVRRDSMIIGSALAAYAGVAYSLSPWISGSSVAAQSVFDRVLWTFWPWALMILGGMSSNKGVAIATIIVGSLLVGPIRIYKNDIASKLHVEMVGLDPGYFANALEYILIALLLLLVLLYKPKGVVPEPPSRTLESSELKKHARPSEAASEDNSNS